MTGAVSCRACSAPAGDLVLDLGLQPPCDHFPHGGDRRGDPLYPLQMWLCRSCGLAQLLGEPTTAEEVLGSEPQALVDQAGDAVQRLATSGWLAGHRTVAEFASPHGGSWLPLLEDRGLTPPSDGRPADLVIDSFGMMHDEDQSAALKARASQVAPGGALLLQYHSLQTIMRLGQWNALRHGHFAYYSTTALARMLEAEGFGPRAAWSFDLYGGTVLLAATRDSDGGAVVDPSVTELLEEDARSGVADSAAVSILQQEAEAHAEGLRQWLLAQHDEGKRVVGYGAASRSVALLCRAELGRALLPAIVDVSPSKHGLRMPGTDIPIMDPSCLKADPPDAVLLFVPDLLDEVRRAFPEVEDSGGRWVDAETLRPSTYGSAR